MLPITDLTPHLALPLPHPDNDLPVDVLRLRDALSAIDVAISGKADTATVNAELAALVDSAPGALNTLRELAAAIQNDPTFAADMAAQLGSLGAELTALAGQLENQGNAQSSVNDSLIQKIRRLRLNQLLELGI